MGDLMILPSLFLGKTEDIIVNKALYTAALVADGWAGAENLEKQLCDGPTDGPTEKRLIVESATKNYFLKKGEHNNNSLLRFFINLQCYFM